ncbi:MAG: PAS domain S-box protein [Gallionellaceae bacterium]|nr:PAS domain S-box protein [Gallionellaceae bacterium]
MCPTRLADQEHQPAAKMFSYRRPWLFALLAMLLVLATEQLIEHFAKGFALERERISVHENLATVRARLEGVINANLLLVHGLTAVISAHPEIDQAEFSRIARSLVNPRHALRNIAGAPDMVISLMYPLEGNQAAIGLDYRHHPTQRDAALRVMATGQAVVAGPLPLQQGGTGIVAREPVYLPAAAADEKPRFWGLVAAVIDVDVLYRLAGLAEPDANLRMAFRGIDGKGARGAVFFGDARVFTLAPVTQEVFLPGGTWQIAAIPAKGWGQPNNTLWLIRLLGTLTALTAGAMAFRMTVAARSQSVTAARMRSLLDTIPDLVWLKDPNGVYLACNPRFEQLFGAKEKDIVGRTDHDFVPAELAELFREKDVAAITAGGPSGNEEWVRFANDNHRELLETIKTPVYDQGGKLLGVLGIARDITTRKQAEAALLESETRLRLFIEHVPAALAMFDRQMRYLVVSRRWLADYQLEADDIIGRSHYEIFPEMSAVWKDIHCRGQAGEVVRADEDRLERADGTVQWLRWEVRPWHQAEGGVGGIVIFSEDISERKQAEVALQEQEEFFRLIAENMGDMVAVLDLDGRRLYNSPSYSSLFGDIEALKGTDSFAEIHPDDQARVRQVFRDTVATGRGQRTTFRFALPDGQVHEMESQGGVIRDESGAVTRVVVVSRDITERKHMEDEIRQLNAELEQRVKERTAELATANKELETFTYSVSHDLKAPLRGIDGYSRLLLEDHLDQLDEEGRLFLGNVRQGVDQMNGLIEDLLAYSRMERRNLRGATLNLARQVAGILAEKQDDLDAKGVVIKLDLAADTVCADPDGFNMVLRNLIDNAVKFSRDSQPPMIEIKSAAKPASAILSIKDNGIGFDMQFQERIFEIFQRLQRTEDYPGTGVGLAIVRKAMQRMGGRVWAESAPGQGATFFMELPR